MKKTNMNKNDDVMTECHSATTMRELKNQLTNNRETIMVKGRLANRVKSGHETWPSLFVMSGSLAIAVAMEFIACNADGSMSSGRFIKLSSFPRFAFQCLSQQYQKSSGCHAGTFTMF